jgi:hypothetical protein
MAASKVQICNLGLSRVEGANLIQSLTEATVEARLCNAAFDIAVASVLAEIDWPFARKQVAMQLLTETVTGHTYVYRQPTDCLVPRKIYSSDDDVKIPFKMGLSSTGNFPIILTEEGNAELIYTASVTNEGVFPTQFVDALAWRIAGVVAIGVTGDTQTAQQMMKSFAAVIGMAKATSANAEVETPSSSSNLSKARA